MIYPEYDQRIKALKLRRKDDIKAEVFKGFSDFVGTQAQINKQEKALNEQVEKLIQEDQQAYANAYGEIEREFIKELSETYGTGVEQVDSTLYSVAYERGHSGGFCDVESVYMDIAQIGVIALDVGKKIGRQEPAEDRR